MEMKIMKLPGNVPKDTTVIESIEMLEDAVIDYYKQTIEFMKNFATELTLEQTKDILSKAEKIKTFHEDLKRLKPSWKSMLISSDNLNNTETSILGLERVGKVTSQGIDNQDVRTRTRWSHDGISIKIETDRVDGPAYSNVFPVSLFEEISKAAIDAIEKSGAVKTSEVENRLRSKIMSESDYKKTPRLPVYATFKVLVKENIFKIDEYNSHKYLLSVPKNQAILWLNNILKKEKPI
jgi:hypothetical protein